MEDVFPISSDSPFLSIQLESKKYLSTETLKSLTGKWDPQVFIRIHRSAIVNISKVTSCVSRRNGDYDLTLSNGASVRLSGNYASAFNKHFHSSPQLKV